MHLRSRLKLLNTIGRGIGNMAKEKPDGSVIVYPSPSVKGVHGIAVFKGSDKHKERVKMVEAAQSPLTKARSHLDKETERGDHSPKVGGHGTSQHGGRVSSNETSHSFANEPEDNLKGSKGSGYRD